MAEILVADIPEGIKRVRDAADTYHSVKPVETLRQAMAELAREAFDLIVVGIQFDESQGYDFLLELKKCPNNGRTPVL